MNAKVIRAILICLACLACASCGPHMNQQISIKPYSRKMPTMSPGTVPTTGRLDTWTLSQTKLTKSPIEKNSAVISDGRVYYGYYCLMCHGEIGDGNGPVGQSFIPKPTDLRAQAIKKLSDGELYRRMLQGNGHDPVMTQTVPPEHRWPIVLYMRGL